MTPICEGCLCLFCIFLLFGYKVSKNHVNPETKVHTRFILHLLLSALQQKPKPAFIQRRGISSVCSKSPLSSYPQTLHRVRKKPKRSKSRRELHLTLVLPGLCFKCAGYFYKPVKSTIGSALHSGLRAVQNTLRILMHSWHQRRHSTANSVIRCLQFAAQQRPLVDIFYIVFCSASDEKYTIQSFSPLTH